MVERGVLESMLVRGRSNMRFGARQVNRYFKHVSSFRSIGHYQVFWDHELLAYEGPFIVEYDIVVRWYLCGKIQMAVEHP